MEVQSTNNYDIIVKATLRNEELAVSVSATAPYADGARTVTVTDDAVEEGVTEAIRKALGRVLKDEAVNRLIARANLAAHEAEIVAVRRGEL